ncbi:hypothetical protein EG329_009264 [Mollisiaceae sp. DMI_Dod_QoI]|nr:hypothetical protein EG329_009264 [Helotiales sp. DMI_Dod_QoI]
MASDGHLYGIRKPKNTAREISSSTSLAFTSTLSSLLSSSKTETGGKTTAARPRPSKTKDDIFSSHNRNTKKRAARDLEVDEERGRGRGGREDIGGVDEDVLHRSKRKMEQKAKLYSRMKSGNYVAKENEADGLVDFDRKWAEGGEKGGEESEVESDDGQGEMVDYEDEYGRARRGTRAEAERMERRKRNKVLGAEELDRMTARPAMPSTLIYGDTVQTMAFNPEEVVVQKMEEIAKKRDRSMTPPEMKHYEADKEIRSKGVGFYSFSKDEGLRGREMEALEKERLETERMRKEREEKKEKRRLEIEERRKAIGAKRAKKQADSFLNELSADLKSFEKSEQY